MKGKKLMALMAAGALVMSPAMSMAGKRTSNGALQATARINNAGAYGKLGVLTTESGLNPNVSYSYQLTATVTAQFDCGEITEDETTSYGVTGVTSVRKTLVMGFPTACVGGNLQHVTYANIVVTDITDGLSVSLGTLSK